MIKKMVVGIVCTGLLSVSASAAEWIDLGKSGDNNTQIFLDIDSVKPYKLRNRDYASGFVQFTYINKHEKRKDGWYYSKVFTVADCENKSLGSVAMISYGFKNEVVYSYENKYFNASDMSLVFPETQGETILDMLCYVNNMN